MFFIPIFLGRKTGKLVSIAATRNLFIQITIIAIAAKICLERLLEFPLSPMPWSMATPDGMPASTDKAQLLHLLEKECIVPPLRALTKNIAIIDAMGMLRAQVKRPKTFGEMYTQIFNQLPFGRNDVVHFVTDTYKENSIKDMQHIKRGSASAKDYIVGGPSSTIPADYSSICASKTTICSRTLEGLAK